MMHSGAKNTSNFIMKFDVPTLVVHGDDDQIVPISAAALRSSKVVKNATFKIYAGAPHGLAHTHKNQLNADLLTFLKTLEHWSEVFNGE